MFFRATQRLIAGPPGAERGTSGRPRVRLRCCRLDDHAVAVPGPAHRNTHHPRRASDPTADRLHLGVGGRIQRLLAPTPRRLPMNTGSPSHRPERTLRHWKARPSSDTGRPITPACHNRPLRARQHQRHTTDTAARKIEASGLTRGLTNLSSRSVPSQENRNATATGIACDRIARGQPCWLSVTSRSAPLSRQSLESCDGHRWPVQKATELG